MFQDTGDVDAKKIEMSFALGEFKFGRFQLIAVVADAALNTFVNDVVQVINLAAGVANHDASCRSRSAAALIYDRLLRRRRVPTSFR